MSEPGGTRPEGAGGDGESPSTDVHTDAALAGILREMARDVAHEMRSPVQSVVVNLEVLRRRAAKGELEEVEKRADVLEQEVRRLHALADAFVGLLRAPADPAALPAESLLDPVEPLIRTILRARHIELELPPFPSGVLVRASALPVGLAFVRLLLALTGGIRSGTLTIEGDPSPETFTFGIQLRLQPGDGAGAAIAAARERLVAVLPAANAWLGATGGTAALATGSDSVGVSASLVLPRAT